MLQGGGVEEAAGKLFRGAELERQGLRAEYSLATLSKPSFPSSSFINLIMLHRVALHLRHCMQPSAFPTSST